jgi:hypothetical protein
MFCPSQELPDKLFSYNDIHYNIIVGYIFRQFGLDVMLVNVPLDKLAYLILMCEYYITDDVLMYQISQYFRDRRGRNRMVVGFTTTYTISAYHH